MESIPEGDEDVEAEHIMVAAFVRPFRNREIKAGEECAVRIVDERKVLIRTEHGQAEYAFDFACWSNKEIVCESSTKQDTELLTDDNCDSTSMYTSATAWISEVDTIYEAIGEPLVENLLAGCNNCIFAYGATGSGKTTNLFGRAFAEHSHQTDTTSHVDSFRHKGLLMTVCGALFDGFDEIISDGGTVSCEVAFCEVYKDNVYDLLASDGAKSIRQSGTTTMRGAPLHVMETAHVGVHVPHLSAHDVLSPRDVRTLIEWGVRTRSRGAAEFNPESTRSHCICTVRATIGLSATLAPRQSHIHFVDFAGSEVRELMRGAKRTECQDVQKGLMVFKKSIRALSVGSRSAPFGDSALTRLLQNCFVGKCKTVMIGTISPREGDVRDSLATLRFAECVSRIKTYAAPSARAAKCATRPALADDVERLRALLASVHIDHIKSVPENLVTVDGSPYRHDLVGNISRVATNCASGHSEDEGPSAHPKNNVRVASIARPQSVYAAAGDDPLSGPHYLSEDPRATAVPSYAAISAHRRPTESAPGTPLHGTAAKRSTSIGRLRASTRGMTKKGMRDESEGDDDENEEKPYLLNVSDDPAAFNGIFLVLFMEKGAEITVGSNSDNDVCISERGVAPYMCTLVNKGNAEVTLTLDAVGDTRKIAESADVLLKPLSVLRKRKQVGRRRQPEEDEALSSVSRSPRSEDRTPRLSVLSPSPSSARGHSPPGGPKRRILLTKERVDGKPEKKWMTSGRVYSLADQDVLTFGGSISFRLIMPRKAVAFADDAKDNASSASSTAADFPRILVEDSSSSSDSMAPLTEKDDDFDAADARDAMHSSIAVWAHKSHRAVTGWRKRTSSRKKRNRGNAALNVLLNALKCGKHDQAYVTTKWCALDLYSRPLFSSRTEMDAKWTTMVEAFLTQMTRVASLVQECYELTRVMKPDSRLHFSLGVVNDLFTYTQAAPTLVVCAWKNNRRGMAYWRYIVRTKVMGRAPDSIGGQRCARSALSLHDAARQLVSGTGSATLEDIVAMWDLWDFRRRLLMMRRLHERAMVKGLEKTTDYMKRNEVMNDPWFYCGIEHQVDLVGNSTMDHGQQRWDIDRVIDHYNADVIKLREADKSGRELDAKIHASNQELHILQKKLESVIAQTERKLEEARLEVEGMSTEVAARVKYLETEIERENELRKVALRELKKETREWERRIRMREMVTKKNHEQLVEDAVRNALFFDLHRYIGLQHHERDVKKCKARLKEWQLRVDRLKKMIANDYVTREEHAAKREELMQVTKQWINRTHEAAQESVDSESLHLDAVVDFINRGGKMPQPSGNSKTQSSRP